MNMSGSTNREIKFRQWSNRSKKFHYWGFMGGGFATPTTEDGNALDTPHEQYTGLKDKNGVEIYEGDIFKYNYAFEDGIPQSFNIQVVRWEDNLDHDTGGVGFNIPSDMSTDEVIGNIYENPELLANHLEGGL